MIQSSSDQQGQSVQVFDESYATRLHRRGLLPVLSNLTLSDLSVCRSYSTPSIDLRSHLHRPARQLEV